MNPPPLTDIKKIPLLLELPNATWLTAVPLIVLRVVPPIAPGAANVAPLSDDAFKFVTFVVEVTVIGAVPVAIVDINRVPCTVDAPVMASSVISAPTCNGK